MRTVMRMKSVPTKGGARALLALAVVAIAATSVPAQERNLSLVGSGSIDGGRSGPTEVHEARLTLRANGDFAATVVSRTTNVLIKGKWQRPTLGNVDRIEVRDVAGVAVRGSGTLSYADGERRLPRALQLTWSDRAGSVRLELATRDAEDDDSPDGWRAGAGSQVYRNVDARAAGDGVARMDGVRGGAYSIVRTRIGTGGDVVVDVDRPTRGEIRGRVRRVQGKRIEIAVAGDLRLHRDGDAHRATSLGRRSACLRRNGDGGTWPLVAHLPRDRDA